MAVRAEDLRNDRLRDESAASELQALMNAVAWFELERRRAQVSDLSSAEVDRLVRAAGERAGSAVLKRLPDYRGQSRFEVWAAKFAIRETAAAARRHRETIDEEEVIEGV